MKIAICDDEKKLRKDLRHLLELHLDLKGIPYEIQEYESGDALLKDEHKSNYCFWILKCREKVAWKQLTD